MNTKVVTESVQQFNLKWTNYTNNLLEIFIEQFNKGSLTDVSLYCEGTLIRAHKMVLAACSSYFAHLFEVYNEPTPLIILHGIQLKDLNIIIQFMYHGEIKVQEGEVGNILKLSKDLQVKGLSELSDKFVSCNDFNLDVPDTENIIKETPTKSKHENNLDSSETDTLPTSEPSPLNLQYDNKIKEVMSLAQQHNLKGSKKNPTDSSSVTVNKDIPQDQLLIDNTKTSSTTIYSISAKAFIMFANTMRKKLMIDYPDEQPKDISVRVGLMWKALPPHEKKKFYEKARKGCVQHYVTLSSCGRTAIGQTETLKRKRNFKDEKQKLSDTLPEKNTSTVQDDDDVEFVNETKDVTSSEDGNAYSKINKEKHKIHVGES